MVAGVGNTLRADDGIGIAALYYLQERLNRKGLEFKEIGTSGFDLINYIKDYESTIIIDAVNFGGAPGEVRSFTLEEVSIAARPTPQSTHDIDLKEVLRLYQALKLSIPVKIIGIQPKEIGLREGLSKEVESSLPEILAIANQII